MAQAAQRERGQHDQHPVADVAEHHPEHQAVGDRHERRGIEVLVGHRAVGSQQRAERLDRRRGSEQRRRLGAPRRVEFDQ